MYANPANRAVCYLSGSRERLGQFSYDDGGPLLADDRGSINGKLGRGLVKELPFRIASEASHP